MGQIVTFYSYKGGTGRSMALANVAWSLASNGQKVLVIDWDLEAPGLHRYFRAFLSDKELTEPESKGLIEFVRNYAMLAATPPAEGERGAKWYEPHAQIWKWAIPLRWPHGEVLTFKRGEIQFVPAGRQGPDYAERINTFDWYHLYQAHGGDRFFQSVREQARREFDYVLIDSRTGVSDTSGICTIQMPDILVACYTYNVQSIIGASDIARRVLNQRPGLKVFPVAMRVDFTETPQLTRMRKLARERFDNLVATTNHSQYFDKAEVPYYPKYSFFERLAAFEEFPNAKGSINEEIRHLAFLITGSRVVQTEIDEKLRQNVSREFDPAPVEIVPDVSPRPAPSNGSPLKRAMVAWGLMIPLLISLVVTGWRYLPPPEGISVSVDPPAATLSSTDQLQFVATVRGSSDVNVIWTAALGKINSSGLYVAPAATTDKAEPNAETITETITGTSAADRSQSGSAFLRITPQSHFLISPVNATLKPGERRDFNVEIGGHAPAGMSWQVSPRTGTLVVNGPTGVSYTAPRDLAGRQRVTLTVLSGIDVLASAGIELSPETSPLGPWAHLILVAAAGALGACFGGALIHIGAGMFGTKWWVYLLTRPPLGAVAGLVGYFVVTSFFGPGQVSVRSASSLVTVALMAGFFADRALAKLQEVFDVLFRATEAEERSK
jgi:hypothetical protein